MFLVGKTRVALSCFLFFCWRLKGSGDDSFMDAERYVEHSPGRIERDTVGLRNNARKRPRGIGIRHAASPNDGFDDAGRSDSADLLTRRVGYVHILLICRGIQTYTHASRKVECRSGT